MAKAVMRKDVPISGTPRFWQQKNDKALARDLVTWSQQIETMEWDRRRRLYGYYQAVTGQAVPYSYGFTSVSRPAEVGRIARARFRPPVKAVISSCWDAINNRVYKSRVALKVVPEAGNNDAAQESKVQTRYLDAMFSQLWQKMEEGAQDSYTTGGGFALVWTGLKGKTIETTIVKPDEIQIDPGEAATDAVTTFGIRYFVNKYTVADAFPDHADAIMKAPPAELGFSMSAVTSDVIVLRLAWHLGDDDTGVFAIVIEGGPGGPVPLRVVRGKLDHFPVARLPYGRLGFWGKGAVQDALPLQIEHDRISRAFAENMVRFAWPKVLVHRGGNVNDGEIAASSSRFVHVNDVDRSVRFVAPTTITPDMFKYRDDHEKSIRDMIGVSEQEIAAEPTGANTSGRSRAIQDQITDRRHVQLLQHYEDFIRDVGYLLIEAARKVKPSYVLVGEAKESIDYPTFGGDTKLMALYPLSAFSGSVADRQDQLDRDLAQGKIDKETHSRVTGVPDMAMYQDLRDADHDLTAWKLDQIVEKGEAGYQPPSGLGNLQAQFEQTSTRILYEMRPKKKDQVIDDKVISLLFRYLEQLEDLLGDAKPPMPAAGPAQMGGGLPAGVVAPGAATLPATIPAAA